MRKGRRDYGCLVGDDDLDGESHAAEEAVVVFRLVDERDAMPSRKIWSQKEASEREYD